MNELYNPDRIDDMCAKINLLEYASRTMDFHYKGQHNYFTSCPLHIDKTPSLSINDSENKFYCFSCHKGGAILQWMMIFEHLTYQQAVEKVAEMTNTDLSLFGETDVSIFLRKAEKISIPSVKNIEFLEKRNPLDEFALEKFDKEYPQEWLDEGILPETMDLFNIRVDKAANRIIYPIYDADLHLIGFKGRTRYPNFKELQIPKYINYTKIGRQDFFCGVKEQLPLPINQPLIIFEGIKSVMKAYQWGYFALAAETSVINDYQVELLLHYFFSDVTIAFDTDVDICQIEKSVRILKQFTNVFVIQDRRNPKNKLLDFKDSPVDKGREVFEILFNERRRIT